MPLENAKTRTNNGRIPGQDVVVPHYDAVSATPPVYVEIGESDAAVSVEHVATGTNCVVIDNTTSPSGDSKFGQLTFDFRVTALPSTAMEISQLRNSSAKVASVYMDASGGNPRITVRSGADVVLWNISAGVLALNVWYRVEVALEVDTTSTGKLKARVTRVSDGTVINTAETLTANLGTANVFRHQTGKVPSTGTIGLQIDNLAFWDAAYAYVPHAQDPPPVVEEGPDGLERAHTFLGRAAGTEVANDEFHQVAGEIAQRQYASVGGNIAARFGAAGAGTNGFVLDFVGPTRKLSFAAMIRLGAAPSATQEIVVARTAAPGNSGFSVTVLADRRVRVNNGAGSQTVYTSPALTLNTWYILQVAADTTNAATNACRLRARILTMSGDFMGSPGERFDITNPDVDINSWRGGKIGSSPSLDLYMDNIRTFDGSYGWIDPAPELPEAGPDAVAEPREVFERVALGPGTWTLVDDDGEDGLAWSAVGDTLTVDPHPTFGDRNYVFAYGGDTFTLTVLTATESVNGAPAVAYFGA